MAIRYTDPEDQTDETPAETDYTDETAQSPAYFDQCGWKEINYPDPQQQFGDDIDDPLEPETLDS